MTRDHSDKGLSCFIAAPPTADLSFLREHMVRRGIEVRRLAQLSDIGGSLAALKSIMEDVDFVCIYLADQFTENIAFEAGIAFGLGKPTCFIGARDIRIPFDLQSF